MRRRYSIWDEMRIMQEQIDRMFENFFTGEQSLLGTRGMLLEGPKSTTNSEIISSDYRQALTDIHETDKEVIATVELPGVEKKDIKINATEEGIEIKVEKKDEIKNEDKKKGLYRYERSYAGFYRYIPLPEGVDTEKINASYNNGVLELKMPKLDSKKKGKQIRIE